MPEDKRKISTQYQQVSESFESEVRPEPNSEAHDNAKPRSSQTKEEAQFDLATDPATDPQELVSDNADALKNEDLERRHT